MQSPVVSVASVDVICVWCRVVYAVSSGLCGLSGCDLCVVSSGLCSLQWCQSPVVSVVSADSTAKIKDYMSHSMQF